MKFFFLILSLIVTADAYAVKDAPKPPKLVLVLVFDQFRSDYLSRFESRFLPERKKNKEPGGFRYLMENGAYYPLAEHSNFQNMTCPGHAAVLTGAYAGQNGITINDWYDSRLDRSVYCVEDDEFATVGAKPKDPHPGSSPKNLMSSTFGDELKNAGLKSKVVTVSNKDRAAILLGGHRADLALWFDDTDFHWASSKYYLPKGELPVWVADLNKRIDAEKGKTLTWAAIGKSTGRTDEKQVFQMPPKQAELIGATFPHTAKAGSVGELALPYGVEKTVEAAKAAVKNFGLGRGTDPDVLAVSFSTHDFVGHLFGPNSREIEEITVYEDQAVSDLLTYLDKNVNGGLANVLIVMTGDHGGAPNPELMAKYGFSAGRLDEKELRAELTAKMNSKFHKPSGGEWIEEIEDMNIYLKPKAVAGAKVSRAELESAMKDFILDSSKFSALVKDVVTESETVAGRVPAGLFGEQAKHSYVRGRSGDLIIIPKAYVAEGNSNATHFTGYSYDRSVPILLVGRAFKPGLRAEPARVIDIAPTLSFISGVIPPSGSEGRVLSEALNLKH